MVHSQTIQKLISCTGRKQFEHVLREVKIILAVNGKCIAEMTVEDEHTNVLGTLHGGFIATLVDVIPSWAVLVHPNFASNIENTKFGGFTIDINISYYRPIRRKEQIVITGETIKIGKTLAFVECSICNKQTREICVKGMQTKYIADLISKQTPFSAI